MTVAKAIRHAGVVVEDLERALAFYCDVLGFSVQRRMEEQGPFIDHLLGLTQARVITVKLALPAGGAMIELLKYEAPSADPRRPLTVKTPGPTHVALTVENLEALVPKLLAAGASLVNPPRRSPDGKVMAVYCADPEGNYLELVEEI